MESERICTEPLPFGEWIARNRLTSGFARKLLFNRRQNGLDLAIIRIGSKIFVDQSQFLLWLERFRERPLHRRINKSRRRKSL